MKRVVSVSIGSSKRDHQAEVNFLNQSFLLERRGTNGDIDKAIRMIRQLDGNVDALGMGGIDISIRGGKKHYIFRQAKKIANAALKTPVVDGSGLKDTLERRIIYQLMDSHPELLREKKVLMVSALDRFGMAEALNDVTNSQNIYGDIIFALGLPMPVRKLKTLNKFIAPLVAPVVVQLPFKLLYPIGDKQDVRHPDSKFGKYYQWADIIAGDFHMIKKYLPYNAHGKIIITNTVTQSDLNLLREAGIKLLITTTPEIEGRSFGTNVMEAMMVAFIGRPLEDIKPDDYNVLLDKLDFKPRIVDFM